MDKLLILSKIKEHLDLRFDKEFAEFLGIKTTTLAMWYKRNTFDIELIFNKCEFLSSEWLLTGKGSMLKKDIPVVSPAMAPYEGIPLIPIDAMAGFGGGEMQIMELDCERYVVPMFKGADFLIPVKGSSMYPKYNSGDIVACKKLDMGDIFFQWNKVYVIDTEQGALIKRLDIANDDEHVMVVSDNDKYRPFKLHKSKINAISIVMGVIRLE